MASRNPVFGVVAAIAAILAASPAMAEDSDDITAAMMCGSVYKIVAKQSKGLAAATAYDAAFAMITRLAELLDVPVEDEAVQSRMEMSDGIVAEMIAADDSLGDMVDECNGAYDMDVAVN
jgi:hypothetical protein